VGQRLGTASGHRATRRGRTTPVQVTLGSSAVPQAVSVASPQTSPQPPPVGFGLPVSELLRALLVLKSWLPDLAQAAQPPSDLRLPVPVPLAVVNQSIRVVTEYAYRPPGPKPLAPLAIQLKLGLQVPTVPVVGPGRGVELGGQLQQMSGLFRFSQCQPERSQSGR
jgi:hypothetical protein